MTRVEWSLCGWIFCATSWLVFFAVRSCYWKRQAAFWEDKALFWMGRAEEHLSTIVAQEEEE